MDRKSLHFSNFSWVINVVTWSGLTGMVVTNPTNGGDAQAQVNGVSYNNIFNWLNAQNATN